MPSSPNPSPNPSQNFSEHTAHLPFTPSHTSQQQHLDRQIQDLIDHAPQDGRTPIALRAIAPGFKLLAQQLQHLDYYVVQSPDRNWLMTTLQNNHNPEVQKSVVYAFPTIDDARASFSQPLPSPPSHSNSPSNQARFDQSHSNRSHSNQARSNQANLNQPPQQSFVAAALPVVQILFQLLAFEPVDSVIFFEYPGSRETAVEVKRSDLQNLVNAHLQQAIARSQQASKSRSIPSNLA